MVGKLYKTGWTNLNDLYDIYDVPLHNEEMPFGGRDVTAPHLGVKSSQKPPLGA